MTFPAPDLGVLGGLGPAAGVAFLAQLTSRWPAARDQDHPRVLLWSDPSTPDRSEALLGRGCDPTAALQAGLAALRGTGAQLVAVPCNTAFAFLEPSDDIPDMVSLTVQAAASRGANKGWLLATEGTVRCGLYTQRASEVGLPLLVPGTTVQQEVSDVIRDVKAGHVAQAKAGLRAVLEQRPEGSVVLLGCTELSVAGAALVAAGSVVDSLTELVTACMSRILGLDFP